jgi:hypothetical protein
MGLQAVRLLVVAALAAAAPVAAADCAWVPLCIPAHDPPIDALRVYLDDQLAREIRPMWYASGGRTSFFQCGRASATVSLSLVRGEEESPKTAGAVPGASGTCETSGELAPRTLGSYFGPIEQLLRALTKGPPYDTDADGTVRPNDAALLEAIARRAVADSTTTLCAQDECP